MKTPEKTARLLRLSGRARLVGALAIALSVGLVAAVHAADPRLDEADGALQKAEALVLASQTGGGVPPKVQKQFDRHRERAVELINRAREHVAAARDAVDQAIASPPDSAPAPAAVAAGPHVKPIAMLGGGWIAGDDGTRAHLQVLLRCPGDDVGFNPQPDPPGRLAVWVGGDRYVLDQITSSSCAIGEGAARRGGIHQGSGLASCGGERGYVVNWRLTDSGVDPTNPNIPNDTAEVGIDGPGATAACTNNLHIGGVVRGNLVMLRAPAFQVR